MSFSMYIIKVADRDTLKSILLKVSCFARKIVTAVPSHSAHLACYDPLSIVIIGSYLNSNMTIQTCYQL